MVEAKRRRSFWRKLIAAPPAANPPTKDRQDSRGRADRTPSREPARWLRWRWADGKAESRCRHRAARAQPEKDLRPCCPAGRAARARAGVRSREERERDRDSAKRCARGECPQLRTKKLAR